MTSIFMHTINSMCGAHDQSPWDGQKHSFQYPDREGFDIPLPPYDRVDDIDFEGW